VIRTGNFDNVPSNDAIYNKAFPYAGTPFNGRNSQHNPKVPNSPLFNISARGVAGVGNNALVGGFVIRGTQPVQVLIRAQGPSLANYGVTGALVDTTLQVYSGQTLMATNDDWKVSVNGGASQAAIQATGLAPLMDAESAVLVTLPPGAYTTIVSGKNGATGVAIAEAFLTQ
jgi:hypothetical protein